MKKCGKTIIALAVAELLCASHAWAGESFQILVPDAFVGTSGTILYGVADAGLQYSHAGSKEVLGMESGAGATSRFGFLGVEQLGGGLYVRFNLESAIKLTNGTAGSTTAQNESTFFSREANISLISNDWGRIKMGRQYPTELSLALDPFYGVGAFSPYGSLAALSLDLGKAATIGDSRISNAVAYMTPIIGGFQFEVMGAPRGVTTPGYPKSYFQGAQLEYLNGPLYVGAFYDVIRTDPTAALPSVRNKWLGAGAMYDFGGVRLSYEFNMTVPDYAQYCIATTHMIGVNARQGTNDVKFSAVYRNVAGRPASNSLALGLGYDYNLSKVTALYVRLGYVVNQKNAIATLANGSLSQPGDDQSVVAIGIRKRF
ncbi:porin [Paraburkholderia sp. IMGN_8]|uniref:porin n=1 Tax=Paraburkholderia sp. IMGN_8 TaxID=3136564 RepID=UPI003100F925